MNKELGRKITSLTLMTIMLTWSAAMGFSSTFMPEAEAANQYLWVSAENAENGNTFYGGQVLELIVTDPAIQELDENYGMPDVTLDGKKVIMAQGVDGSWYAYVADATFANQIDAVYGNESDSIGTAGADYGRFAPTGTVVSYNATGNGATPVITITDAVGVTFHGKVTDTATCNGISNYSQGGDIPSCNLASVNGLGPRGGMTNGAATGQNATGDGTNNVVREARALSNVTTTNYYGNIGLSPAFWPMIQLYDFTADQVVDIVYAKGSLAEEVDLTFIDNAIGVSVDKSVYGLGHEVGIELIDWNLNIDPTDEDSWTFATNPSNGSAFYQLWDENGTVDSTATVAAILNDGNQMSGTWGVPGILTIDRDGAEGAAKNVTNFSNNTDADSLGGLACGDFDQGGVDSYGTCRTAEINPEDAALVMVETGSNTGHFVNYDDGMVTTVSINVNASRGSTSTISYDGDDHTILHQPSFASVEYDTSSIGSSWNSGEVVGVTIVDADMNYDVRQEDAMSITSNTSIVPAIKIGNPITLKNVDVFKIEATVIDSSLDQVCSSDYITSKAGYGANASYTSCYEKYSERLMVTPNTAFSSTHNDAWNFIWNDKVTVQTAHDLIATGNGSGSYTYINYDFRSLNDGSDDGDVHWKFVIGSTSIDDTPTAAAGDGWINDAFGAYGNGLVGLALYCSPGDDCALNSQTLTDPLQVRALHTTAGTLSDLTGGTTYPMILDIITFGQSNDGVVSGDRANNAIYRVEAEEDGLNTPNFVAEVDYIMLNQLNVNSSGTYNSTAMNSDEVTIIVHNDLTDEDEVRINYMDYGADGVETQVADQLAAPTHSGVVELDSDSYKEADTVTVTLTDADINTDPSLIDIYTVVTTVSATSTQPDDAYDQVGAADYGQNSVGDNFGRMLDITFDDATWIHSDIGSACTSGGNDDDDGTPSGNDGLASTGFTLVETGVDTGVFKGDFQVPADYCDHSTLKVVSTMGKDIEVNYVDYRDASGEIIEVGDGAGIRANTGSVSLDRTVYPVPFGVVGDFATESTKGSPNGRALFPVHSTGITDALAQSSETIGSGDLTIHVRVDDPDYDLSASGEDFINENTTTSSNRGPIKVYVSRGSSAVTLATAGGDTAQDGVITTGSTPVDGGASTNTRELGPIAETAPDSGVFELDMTVRYTDGPLSSDCPATNSYTATDGSAESTEASRFDTASASSTDYCILQGDVITVEYTDQNDASGNSGVAYDSATFDLRNGVLQSDKSVYIIGSDIIMTLIEPDLDLESDEAETWDLDLIEWDSDAGTVSMGNNGGSAGSFDPEPSDFRETGDSTGIFQIVIEVPDTLAGSSLDRGEKIDLEYSDWGPSGSNYVGEEYQDVNLTVFTSNFGATIELDQKVYTWTDKVYITIVAPDHNFDSGLVDQIGDTDDDPLIVQTRTQKLTGYKLAETGTDTGIFSGEVILKGFSHDADGDPATGTSGYDVTGITTATGSGPTDGQVKAEDDDGLSISYEFNEDEVIVGSALIRWNIGEVQWLESSYPASGNGVIRVVDPDMNWDPENVDNYKIDVWSDSDAGGISLMVSETNEATGIFEGTVTFSASEESSGHRLRVAEGDTVTAEYEDNTLPDPYTRSDDLDITGTAIIGTIVPPLERAPASNARVVDSFGNSLSEVSVDQQVQIEADLVNGQDKAQSFAYLVQVQDGNGVTVSLAWITGQLAAGQSFSPALSWIPSTSGTYEATVFVWESVDNPTALSDTVSASIRVV